MRKQNWPKRDPIKNYFSLPNEIYDLKLSRGAIAIYSHVTPDMQRAASEVVGGFLKDLLGEELNP